MSDSAASVSLDPFLFGSEQPCFGCSPQHPTGLRLRFRKEGDRIATEFTPEVGHQGPPGIMHGGLVTTLADELAAWAVIGLLGKFGFTASLEAKLLRPVRVGRVVSGHAYVSHESSRLVTVGVDLSQKDSSVYRGKFTFVLVDKNGAERLLGGPLPPEWERFCRG